ncbi:MAG: thiamine-phosphate kinase [Candidatus Omnitrophica bacterium]|nr:thiamine-phosphate kinase [Candidatus Omnitrophota bacterium]
MKHKDPLVVKGIGDDCAVIDLDKKRYILFSCDMLIEDVDFRENISPYLIGRKAMGMVLSDVASKGGLPKYTLVSLGLSKNKTLDFVKKIYQGFMYWVKRFNFEIVGGDISRAEKLIIDISVLGFVEKKNLVLRNGAKVNDIIFITGKLGRKDKHLYFLPRIEEGRYLVNNFRINSMIDISDGLLQDLSHILQQSKVGAVLYKNLIPYDKKINFDEVLNQGEEYELLFTLPPKEARRLLSMKRGVYHGIGQIVSSDYGVRLIDENFQERKIKIRGFRHF